MGRGAGRKALGRNGAAGAFTPWSRDGLVGRIATAVAQIHHARHAELLIRRFAGPRTRLSDRDILERLIFPFVLAHLDPGRILDVGREGPHQVFYNAFFRGRELWTLDRDPERRRFGARRHVCCDVADVERHFPDGFFDLIVMNGVFGWGLDSPADIERAFEGCRSVLRPGGVLVLGWNDSPGLVPVPLGEIEALRRFAPVVFPPLGSATCRAATCDHVYSFFTRPRDRAPAPGSRAAAPRS